MVKQNKWSITFVTELKKENSSFKVFIPKNQVQLVKGRKGTKVIVRVERY